MLQKVYPSDAHPGLRVTGIADPERDLLIMPVGNTDRGAIDAFVIRREGREMSMQVSSGSRVRSGSDDYFLREHLYVGEQAPAVTLFGYVPNTFTHEQERSAAELVAIELLIAYGWNADGLEREDGFYRVSAQDRVFRRSDFA